MMKNFPHLGLEYLESYWVFVNFEFNHFSHKIWSFEELIKDPNAIVYSVRVCERMTRIKDYNEELMFSE
jgi:hypothetical protein